MYVILDPGEDEEADEVQDGGRADANRCLECAPNEQTGGVQEKDRNGHHDMRVGHALQPRSVKQFSRALQFELLFHVTELVRLHSNAKLGNGVVQKG